MPDKSYGEKLKTIAKEKDKKERFLVTRMWFSTIISALYNDRGVIPKNIGNNILVGNNMYVTKNSLSAVILIKEFSDETPVAFISDLMRDVKNKVPDIVIDTKIKNIRHHVDTRATGLESRISTWKSTLDNPYVSEVIARRAARLLYTVDVAKSGEKLYKSRVYVTIRASNGTSLFNGLKRTSEYLDSIGASYKTVKSNMLMHLSYMLLMCGESPRKIKDVPYSIMSNETIAEILPAIQSLNNDDGTLMGMEKDSSAPYIIDFRSNANAKNIAVESKSGFGKTFIALNWLLDMYASLFNLCLMDIKGTELIAFTKSCGGVIISMREESTFYINTFKWCPEEVSNNEYRIYADSRIRASKERMMIICDIQDDRESKCEALLEEFLRSVYIGVGALGDNPNTWSRTESLNPYVIYEMFDNYLSSEVLSKYDTVASEMLDRLFIYFCKDGSSSHMFRDEYDYQSLLDKQVITFDFGLLESTESQNKVMFKLHVNDMTMINEAFSAHKKKLGQWVVKLLEESQIVEDYITKIYVKEITMGRARNQINILLGNSVSALVNNPKAKAAIENINIYVLGVLNKSSRDYVVEEFDLSEDDREKLEDISTNPDFENTFLIVNRMQKDAPTGLIKAYVPDSVKNGKLFRVVDTNEEV